MNEPQVVIQRDVAPHADSVDRLRCSDPQKSVVDVPEAMSAVKHAESLIAGRAGLSPVANEVKQWRADLETVQRLDDIVLSNADGSQWDSSLAICAQYDRAFRSVGIDVDALGLEEAAGRIRSRRIRKQLTEALDHWAQFRLNISYDGQSQTWVKPIAWARRPLALARIVDPNEYHARVRRAIEAWELAELAQLTRMPAARDLPVSTLRLAARELYYNPDSQYQNEARAMLRRAQAAHPDDFWINFTIAIHLAYIDASANSLSELDPLEESIRYATAAMALHPQNAQVRLLLAQLLSRAGRLDDAYLDECEAVCRKAAESQPRAAQSHNNLGDALYLQAKFEQAADSYRHAIELAPDVAALYVKLGLALQRLGRIAESQLAWQTATELMSHNAGNLNQLAWILATAPDPQHRDPAYAVELAELALKYAPNDGDIWNTLGLAHFRAENWEAAVDALEKATKLHEGGTALDWFFLAMAHLKLNHADEARAFYDKAILWMHKHDRNDAELRAFREESGKLLGIASRSPEDAVEH